MKTKRVVSLAGAVALVLIVLGLMHPSAMAQDAWVFDAEQFSKQPLTDLRAAHWLYVRTYVQNPIPPGWDWTVIYHATDNNWGKCLFAVSEVGASEIRPGRAFISTYRGCGNGVWPLKEGIVKTDIFPIRPVLAWSEPYVLTLRSDGGDAVSPLRNALGGLPFGNSMHQVGKAECDCSGCVYWTVRIPPLVLYSSTPPHGYVDAVAVTCNDGDDKVYAYGFQPETVTYITKGWACNPGNVPAVAARPAHYGYQCAGPVYTGDGRRIWPEFCVINGVNKDSTSDRLFKKDVVRNALRSVFVPFVFNTPQSMPVRINIANSRNPTLKDFSFMFGDLKVKILDDQGNVLAGPMTISGSGVVLIPMGGNVMEIQVPPLKKFKDVYPSADVDESKNANKWVRIRIVMARLDTGKWEVLYDQTFRGDSAPPNLPVFRVKNISSIRGGVVVRGMISWWPDHGGPFGLWDTPDAYSFPVTVSNAWNLIRREWSDADARHDERFDLLTRVNRHASVYDLINALLNTNGANSVHHTFGADVTGSAFQAQVSFVTYHLEPPPSVPSPTVWGMQEQNQQTTSGFSLEILNDTPFRIGYKYEIPPIRATLVVTDELGVQHINFTMNSARVTTTVSYAGQSFTYSDGDHAVFTRMVEQRFYNPKNTLLGSNWGYANASNSTPLVVRLQYQMSGTVVVNYRFADGTVQSIPITVRYPKDNLLTHEAQFLVRYSDFAR